MLVKPTRNERGNIGYLLTRSTENPDELVCDKMFSSIEKFGEHAQRPCIKGLTPRMKSLVASQIEERTYSEVKGGR